MVMWQILIGWALKAWNNQLFGPMRGSAVHAFLSKRAKKRKSSIITKQKPFIGFKMSDSLVKEPYFYKVRSKVNASALEEHQASSSENCDSLTLWRCDFTTLPSLRVTERHTYLFYTVTCETCIRY